MKDERYRILKKQKAIHKVLLCMALAGIAFVIASFSKIDLLSRIMIGWNTFSITMLAIDWIIFFHTESKQIRTQAKVEDSSRLTIFTIVLVSTLASLLAVTLLLISSDKSHKVLHMVVAIGKVDVILDWHLK